jgi:hypothetical protein
MLAERGSKFNAGTNKNAFLVDLREAGISAQRPACRLAAILFPSTPLLIPPAEGWEVPAVRQATVVRNYLALANGRAI